MNDRSPTREQILAAIADASKIVASWPLWKQDILRDSAKPMFDKPREPVDNTR